MSYILDALKKADSERERGSVPGLNSSQANHATFIHYGRDQKPWWLLALVLAVLLVLVLALWAWRQSGPSPLAALTDLRAVPASPVAASPEVPVVPPVPAQTPEPARLPSPVAPAAALQKPEVTVRAPTPPPVVSTANPLPPAASTVAHVQAKVAPAAASPAQPASPLAAVPPEAAGKPVPMPAPMPAPIRSTTGGIPQLSDLPDTLRRQIPALNISGAIFSDAPPEWTLIINDQVMGKGSQVAPDVRLEEISASSAVFNFKGQRFRVER
jgi:general secretion pathway protein B